MRSSRIASFLVLLALVLCLFAPGRLAAPQPAEIGLGPESSLSAESLSGESSPLLIAAYHGYENSETLSGNSDDQGGGIKEVVPDKYLSRYKEWKKSFLPLKWVDRTGRCLNTTQTLR